MKELFYFVSLTLIFKVSHKNDIQFEFHLRFSFSQSFETILASNENSVRKFDSTFPFDFRFKLKTFIDVFTGKCFLRNVDNNWQHNKYMGFYISNKYQIKLFNLEASLAKVCN